MTIHIIARDERDYYCWLQWGCWRALAFSAGGDGGRRSPELLTRSATFCGSQQLPNNRDLSVHASGIPFPIRRLELPHVAAEVIVASSGAASEAHHQWL